MATDPMRFAAFLCVGWMLAWAGPALGAVAVSGIGTYSTTGGGDSSDYVVTTTAAAASGDVVVCAMGSELAGGVTIGASMSDSGSNTWTLETQINSTPLGHSAVWFGWSKLTSGIANSGNIHLQVTGATGYRSMACAKITGVTGASTVKDQYKIVPPTSSNQNESTGGPSITLATLAQSVEVAISSTQLFLDATYTENSPYTLISHVSNTNNGLTLSYDITASTTGPVYAPTVTGGSGMAAGVLALEVTASGGGSSAAGSLQWDN